LELIADAVLAADLASLDDFNRTVGELYAFASAENTLLAIPRIVQAWGRRAPL
jgi:hypothetical protein